MRLASNSLVAATSGRAVWPSIGGVLRRSATKASEADYRILPSVGIFEPPGTVWINNDDEWARRVELVVGCSCQNLRRSNRSNADK
jgi:hypothetical protein